MSLALMTTGHELRQGLQRLLGSVDRLRHGARGVDSEEDVATDLKRMITELAGDFERLALLAAATISDDQAPLLSPTDVLPIVEVACTRWRGEAGRKSLDLRLDSCDVTAVTNAAWLAVIMSNVIGNAVRHTSAGEVSVKASSAGAQLTLCVNDSGPGIMDAVLERAFDASVSPRISDGGLGLGLWIARRAASLLGHGFGVSSTPNKGTTIHLRISPSKPILPAAGLEAHPFLGAG